jgi:hypothetical protein
LELKARRVFALKNNAPVTCPPPPLLLKNNNNNNNMNSLAYLITQEPPVLYKFLHSLSSNASVGIISPFPVISIHFFITFFSGGVVMKHKQNKFQQNKSVNHK